MIIKRTIAACLHRNLTFAIFRSRKRVHLWVGREPGLVQIPWSEMDRKKDVFVVQPFLPHPAYCTVLDPGMRFDLTAGDDLDRLTTALSGSRHRKGEMIHWEKQQYREAVMAVKERMATSDLEKVVLSRTMDMEVDPLLIPDLFENALKEQPEAFVCLLNCPEYGTWMGASPEMLVKVKGSRIRVDAIAGTLPLVAAPSDPAQWGGKEREEQAIVSRSVLNTFLELGLHEVSVSGPAVLHAAHVAHLHTLIGAETGTVPLSTIVKALHPTPAVCGMPREESLNAIQKFEPHTRSLYSGYWGPWRMGGRTSLHVNIRCMHLLDHRAVLYLGGGITAGSDPEKEWAETMHKALTWQRPLEALRAGIS